jgi:hypothetical protein
MKFCPNCGTQVVEAARFCRACGATLESRKTEAPPPPLPPLPTRQPPPPTPQPSANAIVPELETPPAPPAKGVSVTWQKGERGQLRRVDQPPETAVATATSRGSPPTNLSAGTMESASSQTGNSSGAVELGKTIFAGFGRERTDLPPTPPVWGFRLQTTEFADKLVKGIVPQKQDKPNPFIECLTRVIRGAFLHRDVYRSSASGGSLTVEAACVGAALVVISTVGLNFGILVGNGSSFIIKAMIARAAGWIGAVVAIHLVAKQWQQIAVPPVAWFRGLIYAQPAMLLWIVPGLGGLANIWAAICTLAALQDISGKDIKVSITLLGVAWLAVMIIAFGINSLQF